MFRIHHEWALQDAKAKLSAVVDLAATEGPQRITRHGRSAAVLLSEADFQRMRGRRRESLSTFLARSGLGTLDIDRNSEDEGREIDL